MVTARPELVVEPLVGSFGAFLHTVSPVTAALHLARAQIPTLESYLEAPEEHYAAAQHPATKGGAFVGRPPEDVVAVKALLEALRAETELLSLAEDVHDLSTVVDEGADGHDVAPVYARLPESVRGFVEIVYDDHHRPRCRFREAMLYRSRYATSRRQGLALGLHDGDERPFVLSTPRVAGPDTAVVAIPLADPGLDVVMRSRHEPVRFGDLVDGLGLDVEQRAWAARAWTEAAPGPAADGPPTGGAVRVRYFGHACLLMETAEVTVLVDPFISQRPGADRYWLGDLPPRIDYCLITHGHADHLVLETLLALRARVRTVVVPRNLDGELFDPSLRLCLEHLGFEDVREVRDGDEIALPGGAAVALPFVGEHGDLPIAAKTTYLVALGDRRLFVGADTRGYDLDLLAFLRREFGGVDDVFIGMECQGAPLTWMYGNLFPAPVDRRTSQSRRLNGCDAVEAAQLAEALGARRVFVYAMGEEPWLQHVMATSYTPDSFQYAQIDELEALCGSGGVGFQHLVNRADIGA